MKTKGLLALIFLALLAAVYFLYTSNQTVKTELVKVRGEQEELNQLRTQVPDIKKLKEEVQELENLRKENAEIHRLRNEIRELNNDKQKLAQQLQQTQQLLAKAQNELQTQQQLFRQSAQTANPNNTFVVVNQDPNAARNSCIANLKQLDGAKEQWALENRKATGALPNFEDLIGPEKYIRTPPVCPAGGQYVLHPVGATPTCTIPDHKLPE